MTDTISELLTFWPERKVVLSLLLGYAICPSKERGGDDETLSSSYNGAAARIP